MDLWRAANIVIAVLVVVFAVVAIARYTDRGPLRLMLMGCVLFGITVIIGSASAIHDDAGFRLPVPFVTATGAYFLIATMHMLKRRHDDHDDHRTEVP